MSLYKQGLAKEKARVLVPLGVRRPAPRKDVSSPSLYKTAIDQFYHLVEASKEITLSKAVQVLDQDPLQLEEWAQVLEHQGLIELDYPPTGGTVFRMKGVVALKKKSLFGWKP